MKYLLEINGKFYDIKLEMGETKQLEYQKGEFVNVTASTICDEPTLTKTGSGFLRLEFSNGKVCEQLANIARPIDGLTEQEKECVRIAMRITQHRGWSLRHHLGCAGKNRPGTWQAYRPCITHQRAELKAGKPISLSALFLV